MKVTERQKKRNFIYAILLAACVLLARPMNAVNASTYNTYGNDESTGTYQNGDYNPDGSTYNSGVTTYGNESGYNTNSTSDADEPYPEVDGQIIFIGDSRTVGMEKIIGYDDNLWSAKEGIGFYWMNSVGVPQIKQYVGENTRVVFLMGVNDVYDITRIDAYTTYFQALMEQWQPLGAKMYYVSVNPITWDAVAYGKITNEKIELWNEVMAESLPEGMYYIDTYSEIYGQVYAGDGLHYDADSYRLIYRLILQDIADMDAYPYGREMISLPSDDTEETTIETPETTENEPRKESKPTGFRGFLNTIWNSSVIVWFRQIFDGFRKG